MTHTPSPEAALPSAAARTTDLQVLQIALDRAYDNARQVDYRLGSPEMAALNQAEARYQQAKRY